MNCLEPPPVTEEAKGGFDLGVWSSRILRGEIASNQFVRVAMPERPQEDTPATKKKIVAPTNRGWYRVCTSAMSLLNKNFNSQWCAALNTGELYTHFAMIHDDVKPESFWVDVLIDELAKHHADIMSAVLPIKDKRGLTSTCIRNTRTGDNRRLTMYELDKLPDTFSIDDVVEAGICPHDTDQILGVNTGLWVCPWDREWVEKFPGFRSQDEIVRREDGRFVPATLSEDWWASEAWARWGLKVMATKKVPADHLLTPKSEKGFPNYCVWGTEQTDPGDEY